MVVMLCKIYFHNNKSVIKTKRTRFFNFLVSKIATRNMEMRVTAARYFYCPKTSKSEEEIRGLEILN